MNEQTLVINDLLAFLSCKYHMISKDDLIKSIKDFYSDSDIEDAKDTFFAALPPKKSSKLCDKVKDKDHLDGLYESFRKIPEKYLPLFACKNINNIPQLELAAVTEDSILEDDCAPFNFRTEQRNMKLQIKKITTVINEIKDHLNDLATESIYNDEENNPTPTVYLQSLHNDDIHFEDKIDIKPSLNSEAVAYDENGDTNIEESIYLGNSDKEYSFDPSSKGEEKSIEISSSEMIENEDILNTNSIDCISEVETVDATTDSAEETVLNETAIFMNIPVPNQCNICGQVFKNKRKRDWHMRSHTIVNCFDCMLCHKGFKSRNLLHNHFIICMKETKNKLLLQDNICSICGRLYGNRLALKQHSHVHSPSRPFSCPTCSYRFLSEKGMNTHVRVVHNSLNKYFCPLCNFSYISNGYLRHHIRTHTGERPYECSVCRYKASTAYILSRHMKRHGPQVEVKCDICGYVCLGSQKLYSHKSKKHRKENIKCTLCDMEFKNCSMYHKHYMSHNGEKPFKCSVCPYAGNSNFGLRKHIKIHGGENPLSCSQCNVPFRTKYSLKRHTKKSHSNSSELLSKILLS